MTPRSIVMVFAALVACAAPIRAEVLGPLLPRKAIEMGLMVRDTDRIFVYEGEETRFTQRDEPFTIRYGISSTATLSLELDANPFDIDDNGIYYTVGASIQALIWRHSAYAITVGASYARTLAINPIEPKTQYYEQNLDWTLLGQRSFGVRNQELTVWLGPRLSYMSVTPQAPHEEDYQESQNLFGGVMGTGLLLVEHIVLEGQLMWIDEVEYRVTLGFRF